MTTYKNSENSFTIFNNSNKYIIQTNLDNSLFELSEILYENKDWDNVGIFINSFKTSNFDINQVEMFIQKYTIQLLRCKKLNIPYNQFSYEVTEDLKIKYLK